MLTMMLLVMGCRSSDDAAWQATLDEARALVSAHATAVRGAGTLQEVTALEEGYATDWADLHDQMREHMAGGCGMHGDGMSMMDDADGTLDDLDDAVTEHLHDHDAHTDVAECHAAEEVDEGPMVDGFEHLGSGGMPCAGASESEAQTP